MREFPEVARSSFAKATEQATSQAINATMHTVCENPILLHSIISGGLLYWMNNAAHSFAGFAVDDQILRDMFHYFAAQADSNPSRKLDELLKAEAN